MTTELACAVNVPDRGQAIVLNNRDWKAWLQFVLDNYSCRFYVILCLTGTYALRCTEARLCRTPMNKPVNITFKLQLQIGKMPLVLFCFCIYSIRTNNRWINVRVML